MANASYQKVLVKVVDTEERRLVVLRDVWSDTLLEKSTKFERFVFDTSLSRFLDDIVNIIGNWDGSITGTPAITISSKENLLIHHPDYLISSTTLSEGSVCRRKPLISTLVRTAPNIRPSSLWGHILHDVVETCLNENRWDDKFINDEIDDGVRESLLDLLRIGTTIEEATAEIKKRASGLKEFSKRYIGKKPKVE